MWLIRRGEKTILQPFPDRNGYVIDVQIFHKAVRDSLDDYLSELRDPTRDELRANLWTKMDHISNVRVQRGAVYAVEAEHDE